MKKATISRNSSGTFITVLDAQKEFNLSRNLVMRIAQEADAVYKIGSRMIRIDAEKLQNYIRAEYGVK